MPDVKSNRSRLLQWILPEKRYRRWRQSWILRFFGINGQCYVRHVPSNQKSQQCWGSHCCLLTYIHSEDDFFFFWIFFRNCICCRRIIWCWFIICRGIGHGSQILKNASEHIETGSWFAVSRYSLNMAFVTRPTIFWQPICPQSGCIPVFHRVSISNLIILLIVAIFRLLLTGVNPLPPVADSFLENREIIEVLAGNLFDGDMGYNMVGFGDHITVNILHSQRDEHFFTRTFYHVQDVPSQSVRNHQYRESELLHGLRHWIPLLFEWSNRGQEFPKVRENCMTLIS